jgi:hypothetical protein
MLSDSSSDAVVEQTQTEQPQDATDVKQSGESSAPAAPAETLLDRVKSVLKPREESPTSQSTGDPSKDADPAQQTAKADGELPAEEAKNLHPKTQERFRTLTTKLKAADKELESLKPKAAEFDKIDSYIRANGLQPRDVTSIAEIAALCVNNPQKARERLQPIMAELDRILGEDLPPELKSRVEQGYLTEEDAKAYSRAQAAANLANQRAQSLEQRQQQNETISSQRQQVDATTNAIDAWEKQKATGDPDWTQKQSEISELVELAISRKSMEAGRPWFPNPEEAIKLSQDALDTVNTRFKRFKPKPSAIDPPVTGGASPRSTPAPKSTMDIIRANISRA